VHHTTYINSSVNELQHQQFVLPVPATIWQRISKNMAQLKNAKCLALAK